MKRQKQRLFACVVLGAVVVALQPAGAGDSLAQAAEQDVRPRPVAASAPDGLEAPAFGVALRPGRGERDMIAAVADWLSAEFGLGPLASPPRIATASARRMAGLRFRDVPSDRWAEHGGDVLAVYDDEARTIYLPEGWTGSTPAEVSVLVHEMVHHMQNLAGQKFACPEEREKLAYEAQEKWLALFGSDLATAFEIDPLTVLVRTNCLY